MGFTRTYYISFFSILFSAVLFFTACSASKHAHTASKDATPSVSPGHQELTGNPAADSIVFFFFTAKQDTGESKLEIDLQEIRTVKGKLKKDFTDEHISAKHKLKIAFLDKNREVKKEGYIEHPLKRSIEYLDENNQFKWATLNETKSEFMIRTIYNRDYKYIGFYDSLDNIDTLIPLGQ